MAGGGMSDVGLTWVSAPARTSPARASAQGPPAVPCPSQGGGYQGSPCREPLGGREGHLFRFRDFFPCGIMVLRTVCLENSKEITFKY